MLMIKPILYHSSPVENLEQILREGLIPKIGFDSPDFPVIWLATTRNIALLQAYHVDATKVGLFGKEPQATGFAVLEVNVEKYSVIPVEDRNVDYWVIEKISSLDFKVVGFIDLRTARRAFARHWRMPRSFYAYPINPYVVPPNFSKKSP